MLAINHNNDVTCKSSVSKDEPTTSVTLTLVEKPSVKTGAQCLAEIRAKLEVKSRNPAFIYDCTLTEQQRKFICFAAGLTRTELNTKFAELAQESREAIKNAILQLGNIATIFRDASAMETHKFSYPEKY